MSYDFTNIELKNYYINKRGVRNLFILSMHCFVYLQLINNCYIYGMNAISISMMSILNIYQKLLKRIELFNRLLKKL